MMEVGGRRALVGWAFVLAPVPVAAALWERASANPAAAVVLIAAYEVFVFVSGIAGGVVHQLRDRLQTRLADHADGVIERRLSRFHRRYREYLASRLRFIDQRGLATGGFFTPELDEVFVDVSLAHRAPHAVPADPLADVPAGLTERRSIWEFLDRPTPVLLAVVGAAGSGKTMLVRYVARRICLERYRGRVAALLFLRDHAAAIAADPAVTLPDLIRVTFGRDFASSEPSDWFEARLGSGGVVLLDGLDEIADVEQSKIVADWIERQVSVYRRCSFVVTSRPHGYQSTPVNGFSVLQIRRLTKEQVGRFVRSWYLSATRHGTHSSTPDRTALAEDAAADLLARLHRMPALFDLTHNPLLLTMIANVHQYRGALPGSRAELYREICEVLLWRRQEAKGLRPFVRGDQQIAILRELAMTMMTSARRDLPRSEALATFDAILPRYTVDTDAAAFLASVGTNGLLVERENGSYSFVHHTFQEYLAAEHIHELRRPELLTEVVDDAWWRETILLYAALGDATPIVEACLTHNTLPALALAFECAAQARDLEPRCRRRLDVLITDEMAPDADPARRRMLAGVTVARQLRTTVTVDGGAQLAAEPVTEAVYQVFVDERDGDVPSDVARRGAGNAATGMSGRDCVAFVDWLNLWVGGLPPVRLPSPAELTDLHSTQSVEPAWAMPAGAPVRAHLWVPPGVPHPHRIDAPTLGWHVEQDLVSQPLLMLQLVGIRLLLGLRWMIDSDADRALDRDLARALARGIDGDHEALGAFALALDLDIQLGRSRDPAWDRVLGRDFDRALAGLRDIDPDLTHALGLDLGPPAVPGPSSARADRLIGLFAVAVGGVLSAAVETARSAAGEFTAAFGKAFVELTLPGQPTHDVDLERPIELAMTARHELATVCPFAWENLVAERLISNVERLGHRQAADVRRTAAVRLATLCLAVEAERGYAAPGLGRRFREIAAWATLLERRTLNQQPPTETIILARA